MLSHGPGPDRVLAEGRCVLRPGGRLAVFDRDYATITLATGDGDPLECCVAAFREAYITDPWIMRRVTALVAAAGLRPGRVRSHGYAQVNEPDSMLSTADRGADALAETGRIGRQLADALKAEARNRVERSAFLGHVAYVSLIADTATAEPRSRAHPSWRRGSAERGP